METDPVSEMLCSLGYQTMDKVQKSSNPKSSYFGLEIALFYQTGCHRDKL
jgi:hypothetical protein